MLGHVYRLFFVDYLSALDKTNSTQVQKTLPMKKSQKCMFVHCISLSTWDENLGVTKLTLCANFYLYNGMLLLHRWYWMPQSHTWQLLASTFRELWGLVVVLLWGKIEESEKAGSCQKSSQGQLRLEPLVLCHWATLLTCNMQHAEVSTWPRQWQRAKTSQNIPPPFKWFLHAWFWILCLYLVWPWNWIPVDVNSSVCNDG